MVYHEKKGNAFGRSKKVNKRRKIRKKRFLKKKEKTPDLTDYCRLRV